MLLLTEDRVRVDAHRAVVSADRFSALQNGQQLLHACLEERRRILAASEVEADVRRREGYEIGLRVGAQALAERLAGWERDRQAQSASLERDVLDLLRVVLDRMAPSLPVGELLRALVRQAVLEQRQARRLVIKVHPDQVEIIAQDVHGLKRACTWLDALEIVAEPALGIEDCLLESPHGCVNASWPLQRAAIERVIAQAASDNPAELPTR
jgi:type III secretion protein L